MLREMSSTVCDVPDCGRARYRGLHCYGHLRLVEKGLPLDTPLKRAKPPEPCSVDECENPVTCRNLCRFHYGRYKRGVDLKAQFDSRPKGAYMNAKNAKTTYVERLESRNKPAPECACGCGTPTEFNSNKNEYRVYLKGHYRIFKPYKDEKWLREQYVVEQRMIDDIAAECGVNTTSIKRYMNRFGIKARLQKESLRIGGKSKGKNNPAWRGGTTPERQRLYKTPEWKELVLSVWTRDGFKCKRCGVGNVSRTNRLHAHHIGTWADYPELRTDMKNLVTLCQNCHLWVHSNQNTRRRFLKKGSRRNKHDIPPVPRPPHTKQ